jgi:hypothetical protein
LPTMSDVLKPSILWEVGGEGVRGGWGVMGGVLGGGRCGGPTKAGLGLQTRRFSRHGLGEGERAEG